MDTAAARGFIFEEGFTLDDFFFEMVGRNLGIPLPLEIERNCIPGSGFNNTCNVLRAIVVHVCLRCCVSVSSNFLIAVA